MSFIVITEFSTLSDFHVVISGLEMSLVSALEGVAADDLMEVLLPLSPPDLIKSSDHLSFIS